MCLYKLQSRDPNKDFYCLKLKEYLKSCPSRCSYYINYPVRDLETFLFEKRCTKLSLIKIKEEIVVTCLKDDSINPDCDQCSHGKQQFMYIPFSS